MKRCGRRIAVTACLVALIAAPLSAATDAVLYQVFLKQGTIITTFGEYARVGDRVVFSMPLGIDLSEPPLQLVSLPADEVDWLKTDAYAEAARYQRYVATRAESDFDQMSAEVAATLNRIATTTDPAARLQIAERARETLAQWPSANYGYRSEEVRQITGLLDEVIMDLRASTGASAFDLSLVAAVIPPTSVRLLPPPTLRDVIEQTFAVARLTDAPAERMSLLRSAAVLIERPELGRRRDQATNWLVNLRRSVRKALAAELHVEQRYTKLSHAALGKATKRAAAADVRGVERVLAEIAASDRKLGAARPDAVASLVTAVQARLDAARHLRLARDLWAAREKSLLAYQRVSTTAVDPVRKLRGSLQDIKALAGPDPEELARLDRVVGIATRSIDALEPPEDLRPVHAQLSSALRFAASAVRLRRDAIARGDLQAAWDASSAAAAAMMMLERSKVDLTRAISPPALELPATR